MRPGDEWLGREYLFSDGYTVHSRVIVVGWNPKLGLRLAGKGYESAWVRWKDFFRSLHHGLLKEV